MQVLPSKRLLFVFVAIVLLSLQLLLLDSILAIAALHPVAIEFRGRLLEFSDLGPPGVSQYLMMLSSVSPNVNLSRFVPAPISSCLAFMRCHYDLYCSAVVPGRAPPSCSFFAAALHVRVSIPFGVATARALRCESLFVRRSSS